MRPSAPQSQSPERSVAEKLEDVPLKMLKSHGETALTNLQEARKAHGKVLRRAAQLAGFECDKDIAKAIRVENVSQLSAWFSGTENPQTWRFEQHPALGPALQAAMHEARGGVLEVRFPLPKVRL